MNKFYNLTKSDGNWLILNNTVYIINYEVSLQDILNYLNDKTPGLVCEQNLKIVTKHNEKFNTVSNLDKVEFVTIVGGG